MMSFNKISQRNLVFSGGIVGLCVIYFILKPHYNHTYYYSRGKSQVVTIMHYYWLLDARKECSYLIEGYYTRSDIPPDYIRIPRTHRFFLAWENDTCVIYSHEQYYPIIGNPGRLKKKTPTKEEWIKAEADTTGTYVFKYSG
jgi:hypothetical protein